MAVDGASASQRATRQKARGSGGAFCYARTRSPITTSTRTCARSPDASRSTRSLVPSLPTRLASAITLRVPVVELESAAPLRSRTSRKQLDATAAKLLLNSRRKRLRSRVPPRHWWSAPNALLGTPTRDADAMLAVLGLRTRMRMTHVCSVRDLKSCQVSPLAEAPSGANGLHSDDDIRVPSQQCSRSSGGSGSATCGRTGR